MIFREIVLTGAVLAMFAGAPALAETESIPVVGTVAGYSAANANEEGYWYSRYNMMTFTMQSGLGDPIPMNASMMSMIGKMIASVGAAPSDPVMPPLHPRLLLTIRSGGDPHYVTPPHQSDFATLAWLGGEATFTTEATATTMAKELEWAKLFHRNEHFGQAGVDAFGSTQRFVGVLLANMVKMQFQAYRMNAAAYASTNAGEYALLFALSDGAGLYGSADEANTQGPNAAPPSFPPENRYADAMQASLFATQARAQFHRVVATRPESVRDLSLGIQSLVWYASITSDATELALVRHTVLQWGEELRDTEAEGPVALAYKVRGLVEVGRVTGMEAYLRAGAESYDRMVGRFDWSHGILHGTRVLSIDGVGEIAGAFNSARLWLGGRIDQAAAERIFGAWWEGSVNLSGLQISAPAVDQLKAPYELLDPPGRGSTYQSVLNYRYPATPMPPDAGGAYGIAPVFAASVRLEDDGWSVERNRFDTAGAMHAANELIWFHSDEINGFPNVRLP